MPLRTYVDILETYPNSCHKIDMIIDRRSDSLYKYRKRELVTQRHILRRFQRDVGDGGLAAVVAIRIMQSAPPLVCKGGRQSTNGITEVDVQLLNITVCVIRQALTTPCRQG